jgi:hypothetical protein
VFTLSLAVGALVVTAYQPARHAATAIRDPWLMGYRERMAGIAIGAGERVGTGQAAVISAEDDPLEDGQWRRQTPVERDRAERVSAALRFRDALSRWTILVSGGGERGSCAVAEARAHGHAELGALSAGVKDPEAVG